VARTDPLGLYNQKRDFAKTAEPPGRRGKGKGGHRFVVQKHDATRLHWDFRLEVDGVLKSWAVARGPSLNPDDKRLAVRTEDHPLAYGAFEGAIPKGEYGGGTVMLWDHGTWTPVAGKSAKDLDKGHLHFTLEGERMKGEWLLIRLKPRGKEKRENWLLRKIEDEYVGGSDDLVERMLTSVATGRTMHDIAADKAAPKASSRAKRSKPPLFEPVQLATLVNHVPGGGDWMHETKYDGYRALIAAGGGKARLYTRTGLDWSDKFPRLIAAAGKLEVSCALIDGEIVVLNAEGRPDFSALQDAIKSGDPAAHYFAFDLLNLNGEDLKPLPNIQRKEKLRLLVPAKSEIKYAEHVLGSGEPLFKAMCKAGIEGIVSKRAEASYAGKRSKAWLKVKCIQRQEFVIIGWTESNTRLRGFGALLMGVFDDGKLRYAGKVGTGYSAQTIASLRTEFDKIPADKPATDVPTPARRGAHWVKPKLVAEVAYSSFTADHILRHASFVGLRRDKPAKEVRIEKPAATPKENDVNITNAGRLIFPESGITKGELAEYYEAMASLVLSEVSGRPLSLVRCPQGRGKQCFFQRHGAENLGDAVHTIDVKGKDGKRRAYLYIDDHVGLLECIQMGSIELHGWGAKASDIERPDRLVFDLDPDPELDFDVVRKAARDLKVQLSDLGLISFAMLSGGKGVHVVVPLSASADWPHVTDFADRFAHAVAAQKPDRYVATMSKAKRKGRIFIDWLRNQRGSTAIMPYSVRAREGAPVAVPIAWSELNDVSRGGEYTLKDLAKLIERANSPQLAGWGQAQQTLPDA
jgi:bifunctional non-homologous end joining protein LigD